jgi:hypothetical protein
MRQDDSIADGLIIKGSDQILELSEEGAKNFKSMGKAIGASIEHCLFMGGRHKENFWERVCGYRIIENDEEAEMFDIASGEKYIAVEFFERG